MKNIAFLVPNLHSGGSERIAARLSEMFSENHNVFMVVFDSSEISYHYGGELVDLKLPAVSGKAGKLLNMIKRIMALRAFVKKEKIDVVCSFTSAADNANAYSHTKAKRLVSCRGALFLEKNLRVYKKLCKASDGILFNSEGMRNIYLKEYPEDAKKTFVLYNLFDIDKIKSRAEEPLETEIAEFMKNHKTVVSVGRFVPEKGQWNLLKAFEILKEKVPDAGLIFVGHMGNVEADIQKMAEQSLYAKDIKFTGYSDNPFKYSKNSSVYAMSSISEGFPNALVEAMAVGTPVVSTNCKTGPAEIIFEKADADVCEKGYTIGECGIITPTFIQQQPEFNLENKDETHRIFAEALERMITDTELAQKVAKAAIEKADSLDRSRMIGKYEELFDKI